MVSLLEQEQKPAPTRSVKSKDKALQLKLIIGSEQKKNRAGLRNSCPNHRDIRYISLEEAGQTGLRLQLAGGTMDFYGKREASLCECESLSRPP